jgi:benzoyl-CoA reductase/2-hydroxyglutaryl-CoA dehydratase subunit BcrC/BadD/HgdB
LKKLREGPDRPRVLEHFERLLLESGGKKPGKVVGQFCNFAPEELIMAAGAVPVRLDFGCHHCALEGGKLIPAEVCCAVHAATGAPARLPVDLVVVPTSCDGKKKLAAHLAKDNQVFVLELPQSNKGEPALKWWRKEIGRLVERLEKFTGKKIKKGPLKEAVSKVNRRTEALRKLNRLRKEKRPPISGPNAFLVMHASFVAEAGYWTDKVEDLLIELDKRTMPDRGGAPVRILLTGAPVLWPDYKLLFLIKECGAEVVADDMCSATQRLYNPTVVDEWTRAGLIRAAAEKTLMPCTCPCFLDTDARKDRLMELIDSHKVDGIIHHTLRLCQLYDMEGVRLSAFFKERGVPWLDIQAEFGPEEVGRMRGRVEAFIELLQERRKS